MQDAQLISQAGQVESLASDGLVSVSTGAGQPQKNMELAKFADSLGSSVPLQQNAEQVSITGLYARTSDGKMVELTKESVANVMAGLMGDNSLFPYMMRGEVDSVDDALTSGIYRTVSASAGAPLAYGVLTVNAFGAYIVQQFNSVTQNRIWTRYSENGGSSWSEWQSLDNFGYNTLAELSSGVAGLFPKVLEKDTDLNTIITTGNYLYTTSGDVSENELHSPSINDGQLFVVANNNYVIQYANDQSLGLYYRSKTDRLTWSPWQPH